MASNRNLEELNKNILDENFIKLFIPLIYVQTIIGSVRVNIRYNAISPPAWIQSAYSLFFISFTCITICFVNFNWNTGCVDSTTNNLELALTIFQTNVGIFLNAAIIITNNFTNRNNNIKLFLTLQKIDRHLKVTGKGRHNRKIYVFIILCLIILMINHGYNLVLDTFASDLNMACLLPHIAMLFCVEDFEAVLFLTILLILHERLEYIKKMIDFGAEVRWQQMLLNIQVYQNIWQAFVGVVEAIRLTEKVFRIYVLLIVTHLFCYHLLGARKLITTVEIKNFRWSQLVVTPDPESIRFIIRLSLICILINLLEGKLFQTRESCIHALAKIENVTSRCNMKNIIRVITTVEPMSVYRMFAINSLAIELMTLTVKYAIVLLQFAYS